jgi:flagellar hook-basal body complex protein FliE
VSVESIGSVGSALGTLASGYGAGLPDTDNAQMTRGVDTSPASSAVGDVSRLSSLQAASATDATSPVGDASGTDFASLLSGGLDKLQQVQSTSDDLALKAATGNLQNVHDYMIASNEAQLTTQLTVAVRNKAVEAFNEIMRMQI